MKITKDRLNEMASYECEGLTDEEIKQILEQQGFWNNCRKTFEELRYENKPLYLMSGGDTLKIMKEWHEKAAKWDEHDFGYCQDKKFRDKYISAIRNILAINEDQKFTNPLYLDDLRKDFKEITGEEFKAIG